MMSPIRFLDDVTLRPVKAQLTKTVRTTQGSVADPGRVFMSAKKGVLSMIVGLKGFNTRKRSNIFFP